MADTLGSPPVSQQTPTPVGEEEASPPPRNKMRIFAIGLGVLLLVLVVSFYIGVNTPPQDSSAPMVIASPEGPMKQKPEDEGGMDIPNQDKLVYNLIEDGTEENIHNNPPATTSRSATKPATKPTTKPKPATKPPAIAIKRPNAEPYHKVETPADAPTVVSPNFIPPKSGDFRIQIASLKNQADAMREWQRLAAKYPMLKGMNHHIEVANLGTRGFRHRLQVGTFPTRQSAGDVCGNLKAKGGDCIVVKQP